MIDPNRPYRRTEIDKVFTKTKAKMQQAALKRGGDGLALYNDVYTGKTLVEVILTIMSTFVPLKKFILLTNIF